MKARKSYIYYGEVAETLALTRRQNEINSIYTVNSHRQNIFQKLNVSNALEACGVMEAVELP